MTSKEKEYKTKRRAGKRKCFRCKKVWYKPNGVVNTLCLRCQTHCRRCDAELSDANWPPSHQKGGSGKLVYLCTPCQKERCVISRGNTGWLQRDNDLAKKYGITSVEYEAILKLQNGGCWICTKPPGKTRLHVDHEHVSNDKKADPMLKRTKVRGLLCWTCNAAIGKFKDQIELLRKAADYLERRPAQQILKKEEPNG